MKNRIFCLTACSAVALSSAAAAPILIDDFSDGDVLHTANSSQGWVSSLTAATALGDNRGVMLRNDGLGTALAEVGGGRFGVSYPMNGFGNSVLAYGAVNIHGPFIVYDNSNNFDLSPNSMLRLHFAGNDQPLKIFVHFFESDGVNDPVSARYEKSVAGGQFDPFIVDIDDSHLVAGSPLWGQFDLMYFVFEAADSGDFALTMVEAVPEPATMLGLGAASALLLARRRRKSAAS